MGLEEIEETKNFRIIILKVDGDNVGIIVDEVRELVTLQDPLTEKVHTENGQRNFLCGIGKDGNNLISLLDINEVLAE